MSNIKWSGIEKWKYGLTARWYVSAYYGNDTDADEVELYDPSTNPTGHGGPTRPFATLEKASQQAGSGVIVIDSGFYSISSNLSQKTWIGDGNVIISSSQLNIYRPLGNGSRGYNITYVGAGAAQADPTIFVEDCTFLYSNIPDRSMTAANCTFIESSFLSSGPTPASKINCSFIRCVGKLTYPNTNINNIFVSCQDLSFFLDTVRPVSRLADYSIIIGTVKTSVAINGKTTGVTVEDFKADGNYFIKSYSEVDLFGNASGSGAIVSQLNEIFNNFYYPYIDDYHNLDLTLRPDCDERVRFGGLNGTYIGALPVGYRLSASELWNTHIDATNTSNLDYDLVNNAIVLASGKDVGTYTSLVIDLGVPIRVDMVDFLANFVYNVEGTAKQGVSNQRIDTTPDLSPDNTKNQRVVYDYRLQYSPDDVTALTGWENLELNRMPTVDGAGLYQLEDGFNQATAQKLTIQRLKLEFTLRRIIIA